MKKSIDFSKGERGKYAGRRLRIIGDTKMVQRKSGEHRYLVALPSGIEFYVFAKNEVAARKSAINYFGRGRLPEGINITVRQFDNDEL